VNIIPTEEHAVIKGNHKNQIILGYAHLCQTDIEEGLLRLKEVLNSA
jgi:GntR family transcriptional regulator/MocR family aminotransferase